MGGDSGKSASRYAPDVAPGHEPERNWGELGGTGRAGPSPSGRSPRSTLHPARLAATDALAQSSPKICVYLRIQFRINLWLPPEWFWSKAESLGRCLALMNFFTPFAVALFAATPLIAQNAVPATPVVGAEVPAAKAKPLGAADKSFVKNALESTYLLINLSERNRLQNLKIADCTKLGDTINKDLTKIWTDVSTLATANGEKLPIAVSAADQGKIDRLGKAAADKYDKEWLKLVTKETKQLASAFTAASKSTDPQIKALTAAWSATIQGHNSDAEKAEKLEAKAK